MTLANILKDRVQIQLRTAEQTATGETIVWSPVETRHARVIPLDVRTIASYQQLNTVVSHKVLLRGTIEVNLGGHHIIHGSKTYEPQSSAKHYDGITEIVVREV